MFEFKTRTETVNGCRFYQQDILMFDYSYYGDTETECFIDYVSPGFGIVIAEDTGTDIKESENIYVFKLGARNRYQIITKQYMQQYTLRDEFILAGADIDLPFNSLMLLFKFTENSKLNACYITKGENGINIETLLFSYDLPHKLENYKLGFYSNLGNTIKFASIKSDAPSNWVSNVFNAGGGRINWIKNGFQIEDSEYDIEAECENNILPAGTYYFSFDCDNPDMKYYIYPSEMRDTRVVKPMDDILATKEDEAKNILDYDTMSFTLETEHAVNIKFKGKYGTVKNIAVKQYKSDGFVETDYDTTKREGSYLRIDLDKIKTFEMEAVITALPSSASYELPKYQLVRYGSEDYQLDQLGMELNKSYSYSFKDNALEINGNNINVSGEKYLYLLKNVDAYVSKLIITTTAGDKIDVLLQQTFKINISESIDSPIIVTDELELPYDLSSSFREVVEEKTVIDVFNKYNQLKLSRRLALNNSSVRAAGVLAETPINTNESTIDKATEKYTLINKNSYRVDYKNNKIIMDPSVRNLYKYIIIEYKTCENFRYEFTNYERELFELTNDKNLYLENPVCDVADPIVIYGIPESSLFFKDLLYRVPDISQVTSIDYCVDKYDVLTSENYSLSSNGNIKLENGAEKKYRYLIADYIKDRSYAINERNDNYEVDIASTDDLVKIIYDADENDITHAYSVPILDRPADDNSFIVLRKG